MGAEHMRKSLTSLQPSNCQCHIGSKIAGPARPERRASDGHALSKSLISQATQTNSHKPIKHKSKYHSYTLSQATQTISRMPLRHNLASHSRPSLMPWSRLPKHSLKAHSKKNCALNCPLLYVHARHCRYTHTRI